MAILSELPRDLPVPQDDGAADHLVGATLPAISLATTLGGQIRLDELGSRRTVLYGYPMTGVPGVALPEGWDAIPGARGCTPQACAFRDHYEELSSLGVQVYGLSTQSTAYQKEMAERLHLPFPVLSDEKFELCNRLRLPTMEVQGVRLLKRITLFLRDGKIEHCIYPVFPSDKSAEQVITWLRSQK